MNKCMYCLNSGKDLKDIDIRCYTANGNVEWQHIGLVCKNCRKYLKGNWRHHSEVGNVIDFVTEVQP